MGDFKNDESKVTKMQIQKLDKESLLSDLLKLRSRKVLIIGDVGVDEYILGEVRRISPEAPVPVVEVHEEDTRLGLAANVAQNVVSLGSEALTLSVVGKDSGAQVLQDMYRKVGISWDAIVLDENRPTTRKTRIMARHHHIVRVDHEMRKYLSSETEKKVLEKAQKMIPLVDGVILEDYAKGVISPSLIQNIVQLCKSQGKKLFVDPHRNNVGSFYSGVDLIKPNYDEALALSGLDFEDLRDNPNKVYEAGKALQGITGAKQIVITRGKEGMTIFSGDQITEVPTYARKVFDVTGAGDTVIATLALAMMGGLDLVKACILANFAAGVVVAKVGCVPCSLEELQAAIRDQLD